MQYTLHTLSSAIQTSDVHENFFSFDINAKIYIVQIKIWTPDNIAVLSVMYVTF